MSANAIPDKLFIDEAVLPNFGFAIACENPTLQLCKPKLLPLKTYTYMRMQSQARNRLETTKVTEIKPTNN